MTMQHSEASQILEESSIVLKNGSFIEHTAFDVQKMLVKATELRSELGSIYKPLSPDIEAAVHQFQRRFAILVQFHKDGKARPSNSRIEWLYQKWLVLPPEERGCMGS